MSGPNGNNNSPWNWQLPWGGTVYGPDSIGQRFGFGNPSPYPQVPEPAYGWGNKPNPNKEAWDNFLASTTFGNPYSAFHPFYSPNNPVSQSQYPNYVPGESYSQMEMRMRSMPPLPSIGGSPVEPNVAGHIAYNPSNPLNVQSVLPTTQAGQGAINAQSGAGNPFAGMQNPLQNNTITPPNQKPVTEDNRGGLAANDGAGGAKGNTGVGAKSNNPNVPPNAVDSGRGDKIWVDPRGAKHSDNDYVEMSYRLVDDQFRAGFTDAFIQQHGEDPLSFYKRAFANDPKYAGWETSNAEAAKQLNFRAADAAINDARFLPGAIDEWISKHGQPTAANPIPQEQWETWWRISQATNGYGINGGTGVSQYGVY